MLTLSVAQPSTRPIKVVLVLVSLLAVGYVVYYLMTASVLSDADSAEVPAEVHLDAPLNIDGKSYEQIAQQVQTRDIFNLSADASQGAGAVGAATGELPANLRVVGIVLGQSTQVIIEDTSANKTHFITEGKPVDGFDIKRISRDKVVINFQGQRILVPVHVNTMDQPIAHAQTF